MEKCIFFNKKLAILIFFKQKFVVLGYTSLQNPNPPFVISFRPLFVREEEAKGRLLKLENPN